MEGPEQIPLGEAVARGIIPCVVCGAKGADVRKIGSQNHFLCARCSRRSRTWTWAVAALSVLVVGLVAILLFRSPGSSDPSLPPAVKEPEPWMKETSKLMKQGRFREVRERTQDLLDKMPQDGLLNITMGRCLLNLGAADAAIPHLLIANDSPYKADAAIWLGMAYKKIGHAAQALPFLEQPLGADPTGRPELADVYLDLERYDDALKILPDAPETLRSRHRALLYLGKGDEARKLVEGHDAFLLAGQLREEGDFAGAAKALEAETGPRAKRAAMSLAIESGDLARLEALAADLPPEDAAYARMIGHLLAGRRDAAKAAAWEFLAKADKESSAIRIERMMMRHQVGELKDADLDAEAKLLTRFQSNDLYWYLALASGDRAWAEKAAAATPGHNFPYHSIRRILKQ